MSVCTPIISIVKADTYSTISDNLVYYSGNDSYGNYALSEVDSTSFNGNFIYHYQLSSTSNYFRLFSISGVSSSVAVTSDYKAVELNGNYINNFPGVIFYFVCPNDSSAYIDIYPFGSGTSRAADISYHANANIPIDIYVQIPISIVNYNNVFDMSSDTTSALSSINFDSGVYMQYVYNLLRYNTIPSSTIYSTSSLNSSSSDVLFYAYKNRDFTGTSYKFTTNLCTSFRSLNTTYGNATNFKYIDLYIDNNAIVSSPSVYLDFYFNDELSGLFNSLLVYNYNNNLLLHCDSITMNMYRSVSSTEYQGYNFYTSSDFVFPNYLFTSFLSEKYSNVIFTELLSVRFEIDSDTITNVIKFTDNTVFVDLGFDFNLIYSSHPLVTDDSIFEIDFQKPQYVQMNFTLSPFYIPVLEIAQNLLIFIMFYCPIISDIFNYIGLNVFLSTLLTVVQFIIGLPLGQFVIALIGFFIFFNIVKTYMPVLYSSSSSFVSTFASDFKDFAKKPTKFIQADKDKSNRILKNKTTVYKRDRKYKVKMKSYKPITKKSASAKKFNDNSRKYSKEFYKSLYDDPGNIIL